MLPRLPRHCKLCVFMVLILCPAFVIPFADWECWIHCVIHCVIRCDSFGSGAVMCKTAERYSCTTRDVTCSQFLRGWCLGAMIGYSRGRVQTLWCQVSQRTAVMSLLALSRSFKPSVAKRTMVKSDWKCCKAWGSGLKMICTNWNWKISDMTHSLHLVLKHTQATPCPGMRTGGSSAAILHVGWSSIWRQPQ